MSNCKDHFQCGYGGTALGVVACVLKDFSFLSTDLARLFSFKGPPINFYLFSCCSWWRIYVRQALENERGSDIFFSHPPSRDLITVGRPQNSQISLLSRRYLIEIRVDVKRTMASQAVDGPMTTEMDLVERQDFGRLNRMEPSSRSRPV